MFQKYAKNDLNERVSKASTEVKYGGRSNLNAKNSHPKIKSANKIEDKNKNFISSVTKKRIASRSPTAKTKNSSAKKIS